MKPDGVLPLAKSHIAFIRPGSSFAAADGGRVLARSLPRVHVVPHAETDDGEAGRQVEGDRQGEIVARDGEIDSDPEEERSVEQAAHCPGGPEPPASVPS